MPLFQMLTTPRLRRQFAYYIMTSIICLAVLEVAFYAMSWFIPKHFYHTKPTREEFFAYLSSNNIDWAVGWRPGSEELSPAGFRRSPAGEHLSTPCVSLYGDSFTFGHSVSPEAAWGNVLTTLLDCRVDNYGVSGYGTDQAYLYFNQHHLDSSDKAPVVILSHFSEDIVRNITQDSGLIFGNGIMLKPRFVIDDYENLQLVDMPRLTPEHYQVYVNDMAKFLRADYFLPNKSSLSLRSIFFPYLVSVPYILMSKRTYKSVLFYISDMPPWFAELYSPVHPSKALQITRDILLKFNQDAKRYSKVPIIMILPNARDLICFQATGKWSYDNLLNEMRKNTAAVINLGLLLLQKTKGEDICDYFCSNKAKKSGHYTEKGNRILAEVVQELLVKLGVLSTRHPVT
jgi:hypothetical protein